MLTSSGENESVLVRMQERVIGRKSIFTIPDCSISSDVSKWFLLHDLGSEKYDKWCDVGELHFHAGDFGLGS